VVFRRCRPVAFQTFLGDARCFFSFSEGLHGRPLIVFSLRQVRDRHLRCSLLAELGAKRKSTFAIPFFSFFALCGNPAFRPPLLTDGGSRYLFPLLLFVGKRYSGVPCLFPSLRVFMRRVPTGLWLVVLLKLQFFSPPCSLFNCGGILTCFSVASGVLLP